MERFGPALRRAAGELDLPGRVRTGLLLEMAADLEAVYEHHRARGLGEEEAARLAEASVLGSAEVIRRLGRLHATPWRSWGEEVGARLSGGLDLVLLAVGVLPILATGAGVAVWALGANPPPLAWLLVLLGCCMTVLAATEAIRLLGDRPLRRPYLPALLVLAAMAAAIGLLAPVVGLQALVGGLAGDAPAQPALLAAVARDGATFLAGLLLGVGGLLAWFALVELEARRGARELRALLGDDAARPQHSTVLPLVRRRHG